LDLDAERERIVSIGARLGLTPRESGIASLIHRGFSDKEICVQAGVTMGTTRSHVNASFKKLHIHGRLNLALIWERTMNLPRQNRLDDQADSERQRKELKSRV